MASSSITLSTVVLALLMIGSSMAAPTQETRGNGVTLEEEAQHIALDASDADILPNPQLVEKIMAAVKLIRAQQPVVANVTNDGRWKLGQVEIEKLNDKISEDIKKSNYGPVKEVIQGKDGKSTVIFTKPYNPDLLAEELHTKFGVVAQGVWKDKQPDFGAISFNQEDNTYTFRQGLANCAPICADNHFWVYKLDANNKSTLDHEYATDIPIDHSA